MVPQKLQTFSLIRRNFNSNHILTIVAKTAPLSPTSLILFYDYKHAVFFPLICQTINSWTTRASAASYNLKYLDHELCKFIVSNNKLKKLNKNCTSSTTFYTIVILKYR